MVSSTPCPKSETNPYIPPLFWKCRTKRSTSSNDTNPKHVTKPCRHKVRLTRFSRIDTAAGSTSSNGTNTKTSRKNRPVKKCRKHVFRESPQPMAQRVRMVRTLKGVAKLSRHKVPQNACFTNRHSRCSKVILEKISKCIRCEV